MASQVLRDVLMLSNGLKHFKIFGQIMDTQYQTSFIVKNSQDAKEHFHF